MGLKRTAIPLPYLRGKSVLDVGCDFGFWTFLAADMGAIDVLGLDRNRDVRGHGRVNLIELNNDRVAFEYRKGVSFQEINLGKQWHCYGCFDLVLMLSVYHHVFNNCGDHLPIWHWLFSHCSGQVLWEGPTDDTDPVVRANVSEELRPLYTRDNILAAASVYFDAEFVGPALHEPTREVWRFTPKELPAKELTGAMRPGAGGASKAFEYADGRRISEIADILNMKPVAGSLNVWLNEPFDFDADYFRAQVLDVVDRSLGIDSKWAPRWARFYPVMVNEVFAWAVRFEGEKYDRRFLEVLAPERLRDKVKDPIRIIR